MAAIITCSLHHDVDQAKKLSCTSFFLSSGTSGSIDVCILIIRAKTQAGTLRRELSREEGDPQQAQEAQPSQLRNDFEDIKGRGNIRARPGSRLALELSSSLLQEASGGVPSPLYVQEACGFTAPRTRHGCRRRPHFADDIPDCDREDGKLLTHILSFYIRCPYKLQCCIHYYYNYKQVFAMPEASIGLHPDVGASYFLSRLPGFFGEYLALTGARVDGPEMVACGLASHFVPSKDLHRLEEAMCEGVLPSSAASTIAEIISRFAHTPGVKQDSALNRLETVIKRCFSGSTVEEIMSSLENEAAKTGAADKWIKEAYNSMKSASPTSLKVTLRSIREGRKQSLHQCLSREFLISIHMVRGISTRDFYEGCRGMFLEKENRPQWDPPSLELVTEEMVDKLFQEIDDPETGGPLRIPQRSGSSLLAKL
ncbi:hypothetical protein SAY87_027740 [Trapa incisa]|uniref:3-hydroxyisobutyryl-CoA hydrolase n=1 Tax=Trapa incisa TaxID=236973 RepID=A0AAN7JMW0_9MYRT|nr:hypothetical protein SAY87_027740 [Trapa incisa]